MWQSTAREFSGSGDSVQSNSLSGEIAVTVNDVLPNGNPVVRGEKLIGLNQGSEFIRLSGILRPEDVDTDNTIFSRKIANSRIYYGGGLEGCLDHSQEGSLSTNLADLYHYMIISLTQVNIDDDIAKLNEISGLLLEIKLAWEQMPALNQQASA